MTNALLNSRWFNCKYTLWLEKSARKWIWHSSKFSLCSAADILLFNPTYLAVPGELTPAALFMINKYKSAVLRWLSRRGSRVHCICLLRCACIAATTSCGCWESHRSRTQHCGHIYNVLQIYTSCSFIPLLSPTSLLHIPLISFYLCVSLEMYSSCVTFFRHL